jgi:hypothetical protein
MAIPLFAAQAHGGKLISLDDQAVVKDLANLDGTGGNSYAGYVLSTYLPGADPVGYGTFRRLVQRVTHDGAVRVEVTPWRDGQDTGQTITRDLAVGDNPTVVAPASVTGSVFQAKVRLSNFDAAARLGGAEYVVIPRRSAR